MKISPLSMFCLSPIKNQTILCLLRTTRLKKKADRWNSLNSFGNLTLLTQALNSSVSNGPFHSYTNEKGKRIEGKRQAICKQSYLKLNTYFQDFAGIEWDDAQILKRGRILFEKAKILWGK